MAQMPKGEPRSVPDPDGDLYDEMMRRERLKQDRFWGPGMGQPTRLGAEPFSSFDDTVTMLQKAPRPTPIVTIGDQAYRGVDDGRANVLVPIDDPRVSPADLAERRRGAARIQFMAEHPLGSVGYDLATSLGASPDMRDLALLTGGLGDAALSGAYPRPAVRGPAPPSRDEPIEALRRPAIRLGELNEKGQVTGMNASYTASMLGTGTKANRNLTPPGWLGDGRKYDQGRSHLSAREHGGSGKDARNITVLPQRKFNGGKMKQFEGMVTKRLRSGEVIDYFANPLFRDGLLAPAGMLLTAYGSRGFSAGRVIMAQRSSPK